MNSYVVRQTEFTPLRPPERAIEDEDDDEYENEVRGSLPFRPLDQYSVNEESFVLHRPWTDY